MEAIDWDESLRLGVEEIDADHEDLIACYNAVFSASAEGVDPRLVDETLATLLEHTERHFRREEALMEKEAYADIESHRVEHEVLLGSALLLKNRSLSDPGRPMNAYSLLFLRSWLVNHILEADKEFAVFVLRSRLDAKIAAPASCEEVCVSA